MLQSSLEEILRHQVFSEKRYKKLVLVLRISTPVTGTREEVVEIAETVETAGTSKDSEEIEGDKYLGSLT